MKRLLILAGMSAVMLVLAGCQTPGLFATAFDDGKKDMVVLGTKPVFTNNVAVTNFKDLRGAENSSATIYWSLCPLMPYGWVDYNQPETESTMMTTNVYKRPLIHELAYTAALCMDNSRLFTSSYYAASIDDLKGDLVLDAEIYSTGLDAKAITYCISAAGPVLWAVGLPASHLKATLDMKLKLSHRSNGKVIWEYPIKMENIEWKWIYGTMSQDIRIYPWMIIQAMNKAIPELEQLLKDEPDLLDAKAPVKPKASTDADLTKGVDVQVKEEEAKKAESEGKDSKPVETKDKDGDLTKAVDKQINEEKSEAKK